MKNNHELKLENCAVFKGFIEGFSWREMRNLQKSCHGSR